MIDVSLENSYATLYNENIELQNIFKIRNRNRNRNRKDNISQILILILIKIYFSTFMNTFNLVPEIRFSLKNT